MLKRWKTCLSGRVSSGLGFRHADGTAYGQPSLAGSVDVMASAFRALRKLGFAEPETRVALHRVSARVGNPGAVEILIRSALELLTRNALSKAS